MSVLFAYLAAAVVTAVPCWWLARRLSGGDAGVMVMLALVSWAVLASLVGALTSLVVS